jgi:cysteinyl-tRNA synthetase
MLRLHDTATGTVRPFELRREGEVSMYVCGPTVYDYPHIGHGRYNLVFDVLRRYLIFIGLEVAYVSNVTDVDDHIIERAAQQGRTESEVAAEFEAEWWRAMDALGVLRPTETPHATGYIPGMIELIGELVARDVAYETSDGVYLEVARVPGYGLLAQQPLESLRAGARVEPNEEKRSPLDFALWKKAKPGEPRWESPWGAGRPGWHTECVVMSLDLLGEDFDLHGGGKDLAFPHHENERAQAVADGRIFARHWVHNGWVEVEGTKMSKSLGNFVTLTDLITRADPRAYRLLVVRSHYRSPMEVTPDAMADAGRGLERLDALARRFSLPDVIATSPGGVVVQGQDAGAGIDPMVLERFRAAMDDDLNTPAVVADIYDLSSRANAAADAGDDVAAAAAAHDACALAGALGLGLHAETGEIDDAARSLAVERDAARAARDWDRADALREELTATGWTVEDAPTGTVLRRPARGPGAGGN